VNDKYILDTNGNPEKEPDVLKWAKWFERGQRKIAWTWTKGGRISTVFLGLDHPLLYESLIQDGPREGEIHRYATHEEALDGHLRLVGELRESRGKE
jgi:hypothetical protein